MDMFSDEEHYIEFDYEKFYDMIEIYFTPSDNSYSYDKNGCIIKAENLRVNISNYNCDENEDYKKAYEKLKELKPDYLLIKRKRDKNIHYTV
jgi:hypothetical protein